MLNSEHAQVGVCPWLSVGPILLMRIPKKILRRWCRTRLNKQHHMPRLDAYTVGSPVPVEWTVNVCVCTWSLVHSPTFYQHSIPTIHLYMTVIFNNKSKITNQWHKQKLYLITQCLYIRPAVCIASVSLCIRPDLVWYFTYLYNYYITVSGWRTKMATDFCRAMLCISAAYAVMRCLSSVRLSVYLCVCHVRGSCQNE